VHLAPRMTSKTEGSMDVLRCGGDYGRTGEREEGLGGKGGEKKGRAISWSDMGRRTVSMEAN